MSHDVFICYSTHDKQAAEAVCEALESARVGCWLAPRNILPGQDWGHAIINAIAQSKLMILIFSAHANRSPQVRREVERAASKEVPIIPVRIENVSPSGTLEYYLGLPQWFEAFSPPLDSHLAKLSESVQLLLSIEESPISTGEAGGGTQSVETGHTSAARERGGAAPRPEPPAALPAADSGVGHVKASDDVLRLRAAVEDIEASRTQSDILNAFLDHAAGFAPRVVLFVIKQQRVLGWRSRGLEGAAGNNILGMSLPLSTKNLLTDVAESKAPWSGEPDESEENRALFEKLGGVTPRRLAAIPLVIRGASVAVLYADTATPDGGAVNIESLEVLTRLTCLVVELRAVSLASGSNAAETSA